MMALTKWTGTLVVLILMSIGLTGCGGDNFSGDIEISMAPEMKGADGIYPSLEVDLVGISEVEETRWEGYSVNDYFRVNNQLRADALKLTLDFSNENAQPQKITSDNKMWQQWNSRGAKKLYILVNLPGVWKDEQGAKEPRRLILPFSDDDWDIDTMKILIQPSGLNLLTAPENLDQSES